MNKNRKVSVARRKAVTLAPSDEIDRYSEAAARFILEIFALEASDYLITDESTLRDFTFLGISDTTPTWARIEGGSTGRGGSHSRVACPKSDSPPVPAIDSSSGHRPWIGAISTFVMRLLRDSTKDFARVADPDPIDYL